MAVGLILALLSLSPAVPALSATPSARARGVRTASGAVGGAAPPLGVPGARLVNGRLWAHGQLPESRVEGRTFYGIFRYETWPRPAPRMIRVFPKPGERLAELARRYGAEVGELAELNGLSEDARLRAGRKLQVFARRFPRYRDRVRYRVRRGDSWASVAARYGVSEGELRRTNPAKRRRRLRRGDRLWVWPESALPRWGRFVRRATEVRVEVPAFATSRGRPTRGRLIRGGRLPESPLYTLRYPQFSYASTSTLAQLQRGIASFRRRTGYPGEVLVRSLSRRAGGPFKPHSSHQSGRDVDIALLAFPGFQDGQNPAFAEVDWGATYTLIREFVETGQVKRIYLAYPLQKELYDAARAMGESDERLGRLIQFPRGPRSLRGIVRHEPGHTGHFHVRWQCGPRDRRCLRNRRI